MGLAKGTNLVQTTDVRPVRDEAAGADHGKMRLLNGHLGDQAGAVERQRSELVSGSTGIEEEEIRVDVVDVVAGLVVARVLLGQDAGLEEAEGLVEDGPEGGVVAAVGEDAGRDLDALGLEVVEVGLLDDLGAGRGDASVGAAVVVGDADAALGLHVEVEVGEDLVDLGGVEVGAVVL